MGFPWGYSATPGSSVHGIFQARILEKLPGVGCLSLLQEIFPMQGSNPCLPHLHWQAESLMLCHPESPLQAWVPAQAGVLPVDQGNPTGETDAVWTVRVICSISSDLGDRSGGQVNPVRETAVSVPKELTNSHMHNWCVWLFSNCHVTQTAGRWPRVMDFQLCVPGRTLRLLCVVLREWTDTFVS